MYRMNFYHSIIIFAIQLYRTQSCTSYMCLTWKVSHKSLTIICKVSDLHYRLTILDPNGTIQADCIPPFPDVHCDHYSENGLISFNPSNNIIFYELRGDIDSRYNGNWTCRHGKNYNAANVEVTVFRQVHTNTTLEKVLLPQTTSIAGFQCLKDVLFFSLVSFNIAMVIFWVFLRCKQIHCRFNCKCDLRRVLFIFVMTIMFVVFAVSGYYEDSCKYTIFIMPVCSFIITLICCFVFLTTQETNVPDTISENDADDNVEDIAVAIL